MPREKQLKVELASDNVEIEKYRIMVYVHGIRDIPAAYIQRDSKYYMEYDMLGQRVRVNLRLEQCEPIEDNLYKLTIEKIKMFYLFAHKRLNIKEFIKMYPTLEVRLFEN